MTIAVDPDELLGIIALAELGEVTQLEGGEAGTDSEVAGKPPSNEDVAKALMRAGLAARLGELGLPWAPPAETVLTRALELADPAAPARPGTLRRLAGDARVRKYGITLATVAALVVLWGGYIEHWQWTGFPANAQLWDWFHLLILPVAFGTLPLWIKHAEYMSRTRRVGYVVVIAAFTVFVIVGYLAPLGWTGFPGQTLWNWFELIVLPVAMISVRAWPAAGRPVRARHKAAAGALALAWAGTLVGGYGAHWHWTGYQGNTLWDWLQLLLLPLVFPTILLPAMLNWVSGKAAQRARDAERERKEKEAVASPS